MKRGEGGQPTAIDSFFFRTLAEGSTANVPICIVLSGGPARMVRWAMKRVKECGGVAHRGSDNPKIAEYEAYAVQRDRNQGTVDVRAGRRSSHAAPSWPSCGANALGAFELPMPAGDKLKVVYVHATAQSRRSAPEWRGVRRCGWCCWRPIRRVSDFKHYKRASLAAPHRAPPAGKQPSPRCPNIGTTLASHPPGIVGLAERPAHQASTNFFRDAPRVRRARARTACQ